MATKQEKRAELSRIEKQLKKLTGAKRKKAQKRAAAIRFALKHGGKSTSSKPTRKTKKAKRTAKVVSEQPFLEGFIEQINPTVGEMVRQLMHERLQAAMRQALDTELAKLKKA